VPTPSRPVIIHYDMAMAREQCQPVLEAETGKWSAKSYGQLLSELADTQAYEVEREARRYQVEVQLLETTAAYVHVMVAVDDGSLPASILPLTDGFLRYRDLRAED